MPPFPIARKPSRKALQPLITTPAALRKILLDNIDPVAIVERFLFIASGGDDTEQFGDKYKFEALRWLGSRIFPEERPLDRDYQTEVNISIVDGSTLVQPKTEAPKLEEKTSKTVEVEGVTIDIDKLYNKV
jgi:hypothetical protein